MNEDVRTLVEAARTVVHKFQHHHEHMGDAVALLDMACGVFEDGLMEDACGTCFRIQSECECE